MTEQYQVMMLNMSWMLEHCSIDCLGNMAPLMAKYVKIIQGMSEVSMGDQKWYLMVNRAQIQSRSIYRHRESMKEIITAGETALVLLYKGSVLTQESLSTSFQQENDNE